MQTLLTVEQLSQFLHKSVPSIRSDATRNPKSLPPMCRLPLDVRALSALKGSALAMDAYTMLADRLHRITGRPVLLYWANLRDQFGQEYQGKEPDKDFKKKFLPALRDALAVYPQAKVKQVTGGLLLMSSPPPIPYKPT